MASTVSLYRGDCLEVMRGMADQSVDCVITDPPYGNKTQYATYDDSQENLAELVRAFMPEILRVSKRALITCGVANIHLYPKPDWILSWHSPAGVGSSKWGFCCWQPILAYGKDPYLQNRLGRRPDTFTWSKQDKALKSIDHPCPKPVDVMVKIVERGSLEGHTILDPFMGSGTTGVACMQTGRGFVGIEKDSTYFSIAEKRIAEAQPALFEVAS